MLFLLQLIDVAAKKRAASHQEAWEGVVRVLGLCALRLSNHHISRVSTQWPLHPVCQLVAASLNDSCIFVAAIHRLLYACLPVLMLLCCNDTNEVF